MQSIKRKVIGVCAAVFALLSSINAQAMPSSVPLAKNSKVIMVKVSGSSYFVLGEHYGQQLKNRLDQQWASMKVVSNKGFCGEHDHLGRSVQAFIKGESRGSGIPLRAVEAMQRYYSGVDRKVSSEQPLYSFMATRSLSADHKLLIARSLPVVSERHAPLVLAVLCRSGHPPIAVVNYLGAFDSSTVIESKGLFVEKDQSVVAPALPVTAKAPDDPSKLNVSALDKVNALVTTGPDYSVNVVDNAHVMTMAQYHRQQFGVNYRNNHDWDEIIWCHHPDKVQNLSQENNFELTDHMNQEAQLAGDAEPKLQKMEQLVSADWRAGAAIERSAGVARQEVSAGSCYAVVFDPSTKELGLKNLADNSDWSAISLQALFGQPVSG